MITIFSLPKPCINRHIATIQQNAATSWRQLGRNVQIILLGKGQGIADLAKSCGAVYLPNITTNEFGTPLLNDAFKQVAKLAKFNQIMYTNADMIYGPDLLTTVAHLPKNNYLAVGQRWDLNIKSIITKNALWWKQLDTQRRRHGVLHPPAGSDYFIFHKGDFVDIPAFAVGRIKWDNWMIMSAIKNHLKVIDATAAITAIHQNHPSVYTKQESLANGSLAGFSYLFNIKDANWHLSSNLNIQPKSKNLLTYLITKSKLLLTRTI